MKRFFLFALFQLLCGYAPVYAEKPSPQSESKVLVISIKGQISNNVLESVRTSVGQVRGDPFPAGLIVLLDSPGGDGFAAMKIGRLLRKSNAHIFVAGQCLSACTYVLASGVVRGATDYSVGIHRGRITLSDSDANVLKEVDLVKNPGAKKMLEDFEKNAALYFAEMGMPSDLFRVMQAHEKKGVYRLSTRETEFYGLTGFDKAYLNKRVSEYEALEGAKRLDKRELVVRTSRVASNCAEFDKKPSEFVNCYKKILRDPYQ